MFIYLVVFLLYFHILRTVAKFTVQKYTGGLLFIENT